MNGQYCLPTLHVTNIVTIYYACSKHLSNSYYHVIQYTNCAEILNSLKLVKLNK